MSKKLLGALLCATIVLCMFSNGRADEQCCCSITCNYETIFGGVKNIQVDQCFDLGSGGGKVQSCDEDAACLSVRQLGWVYLNEWTGSGCNLRSTDPCPASLLLGSESPKLAMLRQFRDGVLSKTSGGRALIRLYYHVGPMLIQAMEKNEKLKNYMQKMLDGALIVLSYRQKK